LNLLKIQEKNISSFWKRVGGRPVYLKAIFKSFKLILPKFFLKKLVNQQLKNLLMELQIHLGFGGLEILSRLNEEDN
tara:strand:- start:487 stop:717 length:231 start_codon:yes stop_codon:yes gene_type:complete